MEAAPQLMPGQFEYTKKCPAWTRGKSKGRTDAPPQFMHGQFAIGKLSR